MTQIGFVVADLEKALVSFGGAWSRFEVLPDLFADVTYHRGDVVFDHAVALSSGGLPQLELIQPHGGPNLWQEWLEAGHEGIHHCAVEVDSALGSSRRWSVPATGQCSPGASAARASSRTSTRPPSAASTWRP